MMRIRAFLAGGNSKPQTVDALKAATLDAMCKLCLVVGWLIALVSYRIAAHPDVPVILAWLGAALLALFVGPLFIGGVLWMVVRSVLMKAWGDTIV